MCEKIMCEKCKCKCKCKCKYNHKDVNNVNNVNNIQSVHNEKKHSSYRRLCERKKKSEKKEKSERKKKSEINIIKNIKSDDTPIKILFVGDSYTFKNNMPSILENLLNTYTNKKYKLNMQVYPARSLYKAYQNSNVTNDIINNGYNYVILQDASKQPILNPTEFQDSVTKFVKIINTSNAIPVLFQTWVYKDSSDMYSKNNGYCSSGITELNCKGTVTTPTDAQNVINTAYKNASLNNGNIDIVQVGQSLMNLGNDTRNSLFNVCDDFHMSVYGSYFVACIFYRFFTGNFLKITNPSDITLCADCNTTNSPPEKYRDCCSNSGIDNVCKDFKPVMKTISGTNISKIIRYVANNYI